MVRDGLLTAIGPGAARDLRGDIIEARGAVLCPGFLDLHCHLRTGQPEKETVLSASAAAAAGGFTRLCAMANTSPPIDDANALYSAQQEAVAAPVRVMQVAAVTRDLAGRELTNLDILAQLGAVAFSDDGHHRYGQDLAAAALQEAARAGRVLLVHAQDEEACPDGQVDEPLAATTGLAPWPCAAETGVIEAMLQASRKTGAPVHIQHVSCAESVALLRRAKAEGLPVTAEVTPHHLALTSVRVLRGGAPDPMAKVNPPLRAEEDRLALISGLEEGVIDAVATDHAPHQAAAKELPFAAASFGFSGLETALGLCLTLVESGQLTLPRLIDALTEAPRRCLRVKLPPALLRPGQVADLTLFDPEAKWVVDASRFRSRGHNTPLQGETLCGRVLLTIAQGRIVHRAQKTEPVHV